MPIEPVTAFLGGAALEPLQFLPAVLVALVYAIRVRHLRGTTSQVPGWRQACMFGGLLMAVFALGGLGPAAGELFTAHMAEHLMIGDIGTLLIALGLTGPVLAPVLRLPGVSHLQFLLNPVVAFLLWAANLYVWHLPAFHEAAVRSDGIHIVQHAGFVIFGVNMWLALLGPLPKPAWFGNAAQLAYIFAVRITGAVLGNILVFGRPFYDVYDPGRASWNIGATADQAAAGGLMMVEGSLLTIGLLAWLFLRIARQTEERQELVELARERGVELSPRRAARAVAAGRGDELRERILAGA